MKNDLQLDFSNGFHVEGLDIEISANHKKRDGLISTLLQDRGVLRLISAPHGFGKTELAREYAARLFSNTKIIWIHGEDPDFLLMLDRGKQVDHIDLHDNVGLIVIDGLPWLHEERARTLSHYIDLALYAGIEVVVTTLASCDCLSALQPERLAIYAEDMLVSEQECVPNFVSAHDGDGPALGLKRWKESGKKLFGHAPAYIWRTDDSVILDCLSSLLGEDLPLSFLRILIAMMLLGEGVFDDLRQIGIEVRADDVSMLVRDYPIIEIDHVAREFKVPQFELYDLKRAIASNKLESLVLEGSSSLPERVLGQLFKHDNSLRGSQIIDVFCNDDKCAGWLLKRGWDFIDAGKIDLVSDLIRRCPEHIYAESRTIQAMHAWHAGFSGDGREACHIAERVLLSSDTSEAGDAAGVASRIVLAMFDENAITTQHKVRIGSPQSPLDAVDFLASVIDLCTNSELVRAFRKEGAPEDPRYEQSRRPPSKQRVSSLRAFFTKYADRFKSSRAYNLALHILSHVDDPRLKKLLQELGCDAVVEMRRTGVTHFSSAILVRDMWQSGYFGLTGPIIDRRDALILDGASHMLTMLSQCCGNDAAFIPWSITRSPFANPSAQRKPNLVDEKFEEVYVRLFGGFEVTIGNTYIRESSWRKKSRALLAFLVLHMGRDVPREEIFDQIWPKSSRVQAMDNFYTTWSNCTSALGDLPFIERNGEYCRIDPRYVKSDVAEFEQLTRHLLTMNRDSNYLLDTYAKIEVLYQGRLMPSETGVRLINAQRERFRALYVDAMVSAAECALDIGDIRISLWFARKAMEEDQSREDVYRSLMKAQIAAGQRCPAIKTYFACRDYLRNTLGLDPSVETRELYNSLITIDPELLRLDSSSFLNSL